ncbi:hypothetical protein [Methylobacterium haplocladii]|uniref:Uncharacterized protein n=1 Tax=Methylobacterium haplocladii TaxID=1176176 RepID=A0A512ISE7_9HYPH|nr:hypothetical protein [Methylobacterium haplocladii]GEP00611.1 hypothetical protein MHA02_29980 [Methylobacterium haplocladii]GJD85525.1 hypothetical protein HPGCJGGD_3414 [Methylobacterium haplocladii]GLS57759.1 hypothetical protein GCM10007887_04150 [Methylobacterium haplocladii]
MDLKTIETEAAAGAGTAAKSGLRALVAQVAAHPRFATVTAIVAIVAAVILAKVF